jgi:hypothetical protein
MKFSKAFYLSLVSAAARAQSFISCGNETPPSGSTAVQVTFNSNLNWDFVKSSSQAAAQVCQGTPKGVAYGLGVSQSAVKTTRLVPVAKSGYTATRAITYIPSGEVGTFDMDIQSSGSQFYNNPDSTTHALFDNVDRSASGAAEAHQEQRNAPLEELGSKPPCRI